MADVAVAWIGVAGAAVGAIAGLTSSWGNSVSQARQRRQEWAHERAEAERARKADLYFDVQRAAHHYYRLLRRACRYRFGQEPEITEPTVRDAERQLRELSYWTDLYAPRELAELIKGIGGWTSEKFRAIGYDTEREIGATNPSQETIRSVMDQGIAELRGKREQMVEMMRVDLRPDDAPGT
jgi:hypothetical protein